MKGTVAFVKMHGAGNDFIMVNDLDRRLDLPRELIASLCAFHTGVGSDGLIVIRPSERAQFKMIYYNRDGGEADMCGNGARCAALFAYESDMVDTSMVFETGAGLVEAEIRENGVGIKTGDVHGLKLGLRVGGTDVHFAVSGVPHAVILTGDAKGYPRDDFMLLARSVRWDPTFGPDGTNVNLVSVIREDTIAFRTYERGVEDETLSCGTGALASSVVTAHLELSGTSVICETSGGDILEVTFDKVDDGARNCSLTGPVVVTFRGSFRIDDYVLK